MHLIMGYGFYKLFYGIREKKYVFTLLLLYVIREYSFARGVFGLRLQFTKAKISRWLIRVIEIYVV